jgi:electron transfer flavoprotein beta subunit
MSAMPAVPPRSDGQPRSDGPLVAVLLRHTDPRPDVDPLSGAVHRDPHGAGISAADAAALEHALRIAETWSGRVLAVTAGPPAADGTLRDAAATGAAVLRVPWPGPTGREYLDELGADERDLAGTLVAAVRAVGEPALVLCGDRSSDRGTGALPAFVAHALGAAQALGLVGLAADGDTLRAERRLDGGRRERLRVPRPAVCSVEAAGVRLRRASLTATLAASGLQVPVAAAAGLPGQVPARVDVGRARPFRPRPRVVPPPSGATARERLTTLAGALVHHEPPTVVGPLGAPEAADVLLAFLRRHGYVGDDVTAARPPADPAD